MDTWSEQWCWCWWFFWCFGSCICVIYTMKYSNNYCSTCYDVHMSHSIDHVVLSWRTLNCYTLYMERHCLWTLVTFETCRWCNMDRGSTLYSGSFQMNTHTSGSVIFTSGNGPEQRLRTWTIPPPHANNKLCTTYTYMRAQQLHHSSDI